MTRLSQLPNIGRKVEERLIAAGIGDAETLIRMGSKVAFTKLRQLEGDTCLSCLCGLEGAIQGIRWHDLRDQTKEELRQFFHSFDC